MCRLGDQFKAKCRGRLPKASFFWWPGTAPLFCGASAGAAPVFSLLLGEESEADEAAMMQQQMGGGAPAADMTKARAPLLPSPLVTGARGGHAATPCPLGLKGGWKMEDHSFRVDIYQKLLDDLQCRAPSLDAFVNTENSNTAFFWSKDVDAFAQDWRGAGGCLIDHPSSRAPLPCMYM